MPTNKWVDKENVVYIHNEIYLTMKKNEIMSLAGKWVELEIMLSEISQTQETNIAVVLFFVESRF